MTGFIKQNKRAPFILGVAGGSGSGKTFFARALHQRLGPSACEIIYQDNFYIDQSHRFDFDGGSVNFDHPDSIDFDLLADVLKSLRGGRSTDIPIYDFVTHSRKKEKITIHPKPVIVVDGILVLHSEPVRSLFHDRIFFETDESLRFQRRLERDTVERGRTPEGVRSQFYKQVKPMHDLFVAPSMAHARVVVKDQDGFDVVIDEICQQVQP